MRRLLVVAAAVALVMTGAVGCRSTSKPVVNLDGSPRIPDDQGVVTAVSRQRLTLDGTRTYPISPGLQAFSTYTLTVVSVLERKGQYVQIGLNGKTVVWLANIAAVLPTTPPAVYYQGRLLRIDRTGAVFRDGTVLRLAPELHPSFTTGRVQARLDPARHVVVSLELQGAS
ncbi:MAG: hypothetical protein QOG03_360 [Actinomycetota bacterium]|jgi:hypothetical protein|nr:hypothetical protein [Actinomycetota bacterium]